MSAYSTSSPSMEHTRWYSIRPPSLACTCRNDTSCDSVAEYSLTGTLTSPNETAPFQMARMGTLLSLSYARMTWNDQCDLWDDEVPSVRMDSCVRCSPAAVP